MLISLCSSLLLRSTSPPGNHHLECRNPLFFRFTTYESFNIVFPVFELYLKGPRLCFSNFLLWLNISGSPMLTCKALHYTYCSRKFHCIHMLHLFILLKRGVWLSFPPPFWLLQITVLWPFLCVSWVPAPARVSLRA